MGNSKRRKIANPFREKINKVKKQLAEQPPTQHTLSPLVEQTEEKSKNAAERKQQEKERKLRTAKQMMKAKEQSSSPPEKQKPKLRSDCKHNWQVVGKTADGGITKRCSDCGESYISYRLTQ
jgi:hypothetical protein